VPPDRQDRRQSDLLAIALTREREGTAALVSLLDEHGLKVSYSPAVGIVALSRAPDGFPAQWHKIRDDFHLQEAVRRVGWGRREEDEHCIRDLSLELDGARVLVAILEDIGWLIEDDAQRGIILTRAPDGRPGFIGLGTAADELMRYATAEGVSVDDAVARALQATLDQIATQLPEEGAIVDLADDTWKDVTLIAKQQAISQAEALRRLITTERKRNRWLVIERLRIDRLLREADIVERTGLEHAAVQAQLIHLAAEELIGARHPKLRTGQLAGGPLWYAIKPDRGYAIGLSFGRTHIRAALADLGLGVDGDRDFVAQSAALKFLVADDGWAALDAAESRIRELLALVPRERVIGVAIGLPAPIDRAVGGAVRGWLRGWKDLRPAEEMSRRLGLPVELENDANLAALGEQVYGAGRSFKDVVYVKASTGIGAGIVLDGELRRGATGTAGEVGHTIVDQYGPQCYCGSRGCLERVAGGAALVEALRSRHPDLTLDQLVSRARDGDPDCVEAIVNASRQLGVALVNLRSTVDVNCFVLGGTLTGAGEIFLTPVSESLQEHAIWRATRRTNIVVGELGDDASVYGAVEVVLRSRSDTFANRLRALLRTA
jgi:predicted NBD/HSP70 family sugar kinase